MRLANLFIAYFLSSIVLIGLISSVQGQRCGCKSDGTAICANAADDDICRCDVNGTVVCDETGEEIDEEHEGELLDDDCHCDGDVVHCSDALFEEICHCDNGIVHCEEGDHE
jgi:hypothetical protein